MAKVNASVFLGHPEDPEVDGFGLRVELTVEGCDDDSIISAAHEVSISPLATTLSYADMFCEVLSLQPSTYPRCRRQDYEDLMPLYDQYTWFHCHIALEVSIFRWIHGLLLLKYFILDIFHHSLHPYNPDVTLASYVYPSSLYY